MPMVRSIKPNLAAADHPRMRSVRSVVLVALLVLTTAALGPGGTFVDDNGNLHEPSIEAIFGAGITTGCSTSPTLFCPSQPVTRGQMATFLARARQLPPADLD
ncbi:MAG: hypothetical protein ACRDWH_06255, partial [Acidimicrobiia bacterium]